MANGVYAPRIERGIKSSTVEDRSTLDAPSPNVSIIHSSKKFADFGMHAKYIDANNTRIPKRE